MASAWGKSWGFAWGNSWGSIAPAPSPKTQGGGFYEEWWRRKWAKQWEQKPPTVAEVIEYIEEKPAEAVQIAKAIEPVRFSAVDTFTIQNNARIAEVIAQQIILAIKLRQIKIERYREEDDIETLLLMG